MIDDDPTRKDIGQSQLLSETSIAALEQLSLVLKEAYLSLKERGFRIVDGQLVSPDDYEKGIEDQSRNHQRHKERKVP